MGVYSLVGKAAGASLGFIHGNIPGGVIGYQAGKYLTSNSSTGMATPTRDNRGRYTKSGTGSKPYTPLQSRSTSRGRSSVRTPSSSRSTNRSKSRGTYGIAAGTGTGPHAVVRRKKTKLSVRKSLAKVDKKFAKKVKTVINTKVKPGGVLETHHAEAMSCSTLTNQQVIQCYPNVNSTAEGELFSPTQVMYAVSRLYGQGVLTATPSLTDATMFDRKNFITEVLSQECNYNIRNNSNRTLNVHMYVFQAKKQHNIDFPKAMWATSLSAAIVDGSVGTYANTPAMNTTTLRADPRNSEQFRQFWKTDLISMVIEPGQSVYQKVKGEAGTYDMKKFYTSDVYQRFNKKCRYVMFVVYPDLIAGTSAAGDVFGRIGHAVTNEYLIIETSQVVKFAVPDQIGFTYAGTASGTNQQLDKRIQKFGSEYLYSTQIGLTAVRVDEVNPQLNTD